MVFQFLTRWISSSQHRKPSESRNIPPSSSPGRLDDHADGDDRLAGQVPAKQDSDAVNNNSLPLHQLQELPPPPPPPPWYSQQITNDFMNQYHHTNANGYGIPVNTINYASILPPPPPPPPWYTSSSTNNFVKQHSGSDGNALSSRRGDSKTEYMPSHGVPGRPPHTTKLPINTKVISTEGGKFGRALQSVLQERVALGDKRVSVQNKGRDIQLQLPLALDEYDAFRKELKALVPVIVSSNIAEKDKRLLQEKWSGFDMVSNTLSRWHEKLKAEENDLLQSEYQLAAKEEVLYKQLQDLKRRQTLDADDISFSSYASDFTPQARSTSTSYSNPLRRRYYEVLGHINRLADKILNLESDLRLHMHNYEREREHDYVPNISNEDFVKDWVSRSNILITAYCSAKAEIYDLAQRCFEEGVEVDPPYLPPFMDRFVQKNEGQILMKTGNSRHATSKDDLKVLRWLLSVSSSIRDNWMAGADFPIVQSISDDGIYFKDYDRLQEAAENGLADMPPYLGSSWRPGLEHFQGEIPSHRRAYSSPAFSISQAQEYHALNSLDNVGIHLGDVVGRLDWENEESKSAP